MNDINKIDPICIAPEVQKGQNQSYSSDVFSFSMIAYELFTGQKPCIKKGEKRPDLSGIKIECIRNFISKCWSENPQDRPTFCEVLDILNKKEIKSFFNAMKKK